MQWVLSPWMECALALEEHVKENSQQHSLHMLRTNACPLISASQSRLDSSPKSPIMLPEIASEALRFLSRRELDRISAVSKWLEALIAQCCRAYPLRPVFQVALRPWQKDFTLNFGGYGMNEPTQRHTFACLNEAVHFAGSTVRQELQGSL